MSDPTPCPSCGAAGALPLFEVRDHSVSGEVFRLLRCGVCGLIRTADAPSQDDIGPYYRSEAYISHTDTSRGLVNRLYHLVRRFTVAGKRRMAERALAGRRGRVLDYGCGTGAFLSAMRDAGWDVTGLEPDESARANAARLHGLAVSPPGILATLPDGTFDIITLWHVLEHVHDLHGTLHQLARVLAPGGRLFIAVPNPLSADAGHYGPLWAAWDVPRHLWHFPPDALEALLGRLGLQVERRIPMWFDAFYVSMLSERYGHGRQRLLRALLTGLRSNLAALRDPDRCSSLIHVARRA